MSAPWEPPAEEAEKFHTLRTHYEMLDNGPREALAAALGALYFADNSDYETALWSVVSALSPAMYDAMMNGEQHPAFLATRKNPEDYT